MKYAETVWRSNFDFPQSSKNAFESYVRRSVSLYGMTLLRPWIEEAINLGRFLTMSPGAFFCWHMIHGTPTSKLLAKSAAHWIYVNADFPYAESTFPYSFSICRLHSMFSLQQIYSEEFQFSHRTQQLTRQNCKIVTSAGRISKLSSLMWDFNMVRCC